MNLAAKLKYIPDLAKLARLSRKHKVNVWLVGGFLRDLYLSKGRSCPRSADFDFCVEKNIYKLVGEFAAQVNSRCIVLDDKQASLRVVVKRSGRAYNYDFTLLRGKAFSDDLRLRDFTVNTLAVNLNELKPRLIDECQGLNDLRAKILRCPQDRVFDDDPLRILRGYAFSAVLGFRLEPKTESAMKDRKHLTKSISGERLGETLCKLFSAVDSYPIVKKMDQARILDELFPGIDQARGIGQGGYHHLDVWGHSLETLKKFEELYKRRLGRDPDAREYLNEEIAQNRKRLHVVKLACLLHDIGKPAACRQKNKKTIFHAHEKIGRDMAEEIAQNLRFSFKEKETLKKLIFWHLRPGYLADQKEPSQRAVYRFFRDTGEDGPGVILLSLADWRATRGPLIDMTKRAQHEKIMFGLISHYFEEKNKKPSVKLVDGYDLMRKFRIKPGEAVGKMLKAVNEEQALGNVKTKQQAFALAAKVLKNSKFKNQNAK